MYRGRDHTTKAPPLSAALMTMSLRLSRCHTERLITKRMLHELTWVEFVNWPCKVYEACLKEYNTNTVQKIDQASMLHGINF